MPHLLISTLKTVIGLFNCLFSVVLCYVLCSRVASDMAKCQGELLSRELELQRLRRDISNKSSHISRVEENLHRLNAELDSKTHLGGWRSFCRIYPSAGVTQSSTGALLILLTRSPPNSSGGPGGGAPPFRGRRAPLLSAGPDAGAAAAGGAQGAGRHPGATAATQGCSAEDSNHRG